MPILSSPLAGVLLRAGTMSFISVSPEPSIMDVMTDGRSEEQKRDERKERRREEGKEGAGTMLGIGRRPFYSMMDSFKEIA